MRAGLAAGSLVVVAGDEVARAVENVRAQATQTLMALNAQSRRS
jgi:hypothetical protein